MTDTSSDTAPAAEPFGQTMIREMGLIFSNASIYGPTHQVTLKAFKSCLDLIERRLASAPEILITLVEDRLLIDSVEIDSKGPGQQVLINQLTRLGVNGFSLLQGLTLVEFANFVEILSGKAEKIMAQGGLAVLLERKAIAHIKTKQVVFKAVSEEETVVSKDQAGKAGAEAPPDLALTAFLETALKEGRSAAEVPAAELKAAAEEPSRLAGIVMQVAQKKAEGTVTLSADLSQRIIACLKTLCNALQNDPSTRSPTGKKALAKTLTELGEHLRTMMAGGESDQPLDENISAALDVMTDSLQVDALTSEYMKKRAGIAKSEKRMLKLVRSAASPEELAELHQRLVDSGLAEEEWMDLLARARPPDPIRADLGPLEKVDAGVFTGLLNRLNDRLKSLEALGKDAPLNQIREVMQSLDEEMAVLVARVEKKIKALSETEEERAEAEQAKTDEAARRRMLARRRRMELIAEIAQEFCQPLAVITSTLDMIRQCRAGEITDQQGALLSLAARSGDRMDNLINDLIEICGMPDTTTPARTETEGSMPIPPRDGA